jgi:hypothetical protein
MKDEGYDEEGRKNDIEMSGRSVRKQKKQQ